MLKYTVTLKNNGNCKVYSAPFDVKLSDDTVVIPDISAICDKNKLTDRGCTGASDWIIDPKKQIVTVYILGNDFDMTVYNFSDTIPVNIYNTNLKINISELI